MKKNLINLLKEISIYSLSDVLGKILALIFLPLITPVLSVSQYGIIETLQVSVIFLTLFIGLGHDVAIKKKVIVEDDDDIKKRKTSSVFWFLVLWGFILCGIAYAFSDRISYILLKSDEYSQAFEFAIISVFLSVINNYSFNITRVTFKVKRYAILMFIKTLIQYFSIFILVVQKKQGVTGYFLSFIISESSIIFLTQFYLFYERFVQIKVNIKDIKETLRYGVPMLGASIAYWIFNMSDRYLLNFLSNTDETGFYSMTLRVTSIMPFVAIAFKNAWVPRAFKQYNEDKKEFNKFFNSIHLNAIMVFSILALCNLLLSRPLLFFFVDHKFLESYNGVLYMVLSNTFFPLTYIAAIGIYLSEKTIIITFISWISAITNVLINFLFIAKIGFIAATISTLVAYFLIYTLYLYFAKKAMSWEIPMRRIILLFALLIIYGVLMNTIIIENILVESGLRLLVILLYISTLLLFKFIRTNDIKRVLLMVKAKITRRNV